MTSEQGAAGPVAEPRQPDPPHFDMVLRGYDRVQVDQYVTELSEENAALRGALHRLRTENRVAPVAGTPKPTPSSPARYDPDTPAEDSFGFRAEKLLRLAEREAAEMRADATRDAEGVTTTARQRAEEQLRAAEKEADDVRSRAAQDAAQLKKQATQEAARLHHLHTSAKGELRRLAELLNAELERPDPAESVEAHEPEGTPESTR
jgi:flagellar biosynthesis/type III secretory pathway protein FliH